MQLSSKERMYNIIISKIIARASGISKAGIDIPSVVSDYNSLLLYQKHIEQERTISDDVKNQLVKGVRRAMQHIRAVIYNFRNVAFNERGVAIVEHEGLLEL